MISIIKVLLSKISDIFSEISFAIGVLVTHVNIASKLLLEESQSDDPPSGAKAVLVSSSAAAKTKLLNINR